MDREFTSIMIAGLNTISDDEENDESSAGGDYRRCQLTYPVEEQGIVARFDVAVDFRRRHGLSAAAASSTMKRLRSDDDGPNNGEQLGESSEDRSGHHENHDLILFIGAIFQRVDLIPPLVPTVISPYFCKLDDDIDEEGQAENYVDDGENECADGATKAAFASGD